MAAARVRHSNSDSNLLTCFLSQKYHVTQFLIARALRPSLLWTAAQAFKRVKHFLFVAVEDLMAHVVFIHGIANKPAADQLLRLWRTGLAGNRGLDLDAMNVGSSMVYWADVLYAEPGLEALEAVAGDDIDAVEAPFVDPTWEEQLPASEQAFVEGMRRKMEAAAVAEQAAPSAAEAAAVAGIALERIPLPGPVKRRVMESLLRDVHHYLFNVTFSPRPGVEYRVRDEIRRRFVDVLKEAVQGPGPHVVISHSMGTVIAYDCLKRVPECSRVSALFTIGSPLGLDEIQDELKPEWSRRNGFPVEKVSGQWVNVFDRLDPVAGFDAELANDYKRNGKTAIKDIHESNQGWWRHNISNYLAGPILRSYLRRALATTAEETVETVTALTTFDHNEATPASVEHQGVSVAFDGEVDDTKTIDPAPASFVSELVHALDTFNHKRVKQLCGDLVEYLRGSSQPYPIAAAKRILNQLRRKRHLLEMRVVADALIQAGTDSSQIRRQYAQALIDQGDVTAALAVLREVSADPATESTEAAEARGLIGRAYKQWYVQSAYGSTRSQDLLRHAADAYYDTYLTAPETHLWHGINVAALLARARRDGYTMAGLPNFREVARRVLARVEFKSRDATVETWDLATAMEACVALDRPRDAIEWARRYVSSRDADAFEIASTLRQLKEVWRLDVEAEPGSLLIPLLEAELLKREGGALSLQASDLSETSHAPLRKLQREGGLEKVFGVDGLVTLKWYEMGLERCRAVARFETASGRGLGSGFAIRGDDLGSKFRGESFLLTNAHVVSDDRSISPALQPQEAVIRFHGFDGGETRYRIKEVLATSRPTELDFTLLRLDRPIAKEIKPHPVAVEPDLSGRRRLYMIGHPLGGDLSLSLHDNLLIDSDRRVVHYRTPSEPGSSGSPVFDDQWNLVALHHAGSFQMPRLNGQSGTYEANEGILLSQIIRMLRGR